MNTETSEAAYMSAKQQIGASAGYALNRRVSLSDEPEVAADYDGPFTARLKQKLSHLFDVLGVAEQEITQFRARMLGPWPEPGQRTDGGKEARMPGDIEEIMLSIDLVTARARNVVAHLNIVTSNI